MRCICDSDKKFNFRSTEYKNYLIARGYKPSIVNKHFARVSTLSRQQARQKSTNQKIMKHNPSIADLNNLLKKLCLSCTQAPL